MYLNIIFFITFAKLSSFAAVVALFLHPNVAEDISADYENYDKYEPKKDLRKSFLAKKKLTEEQNINVKLLKGLLKPPKKDKIIYYDEILYYKTYNGSKLYKQMKNLEYEYMRLLKMINYKYIFKRDMHWRTWREVKYPNKTRLVFNYKSHNLVDIQPNCTNCSSNGGFWELEEKPPPCPYEIFSMRTTTLLCGITHHHLKKNFGNCPVKIKFLDITSACSNPVVTKWKFEKLYATKRTSKPLSFMEGARDSFEIITLYRLKRGEIMFTIINSTNEVIYSKIMRPGNVNYVCIEDCGVYNPTTLKVTKKDAPLSLDLLNYGQNAKKKREDKTGGNNHFTKNNKPTSLSTTFKKKFRVIIKCESSDSDSDYLVNDEFPKTTTRKPKYKKEKKFGDLHHHHEIHKTWLSLKTTTPMSMCRRIIVKSQADALGFESDSVDYSY